MRKVVDGLIAVFAVDGVVAGVTVVCGVEVEDGGIGADGSQSSVESLRRIGNGFQRFPLIEVFPSRAHKPQVVDGKPPLFRRDFDVVVSRHAHEEVLCRGHVILLFVDDGDTLLVVKEEHILDGYRVTEVEYDGYRFVELYRIDGLPFDVLEVADGVHREARFQLVDIENALFEAYLRRNGTDELVHAEKVLDCLVRGGHADDVGFEGSPGVLHQRTDDVGKTQDDVVVLFRLEVVAHIGIEAPDEVILPHLEARKGIVAPVLADVAVQAVVLNPHVPQFLDGVGGVEADVVGVDVRKRRHFVLHHHVKVEGEGASRTPRPPAVIQKLFADVLVVVEGEIDIRSLGENERRVQARLVAHKRAEKVRQIDFFRRRKEELPLQVTRIGHDVLKFLEAFEAREDYFHLFADVLRIKIHSQYLQRSRFGYFLLGHLGGGVDFQLY